VSHSRAIVVLGKRRTAIWVAFHVQRAPSHQGQTYPIGAVLMLATGERIHVYVREPEVARTAGTMTKAEAEALAKDVARALTEAWE
jgi:hypothetical protein